MKALLSLLFTVTCYAHSPDFTYTEYTIPNRVFVSETHIDLTDFPQSFNPSLTKIDEGFLLSFRYCANPADQSFSSIGVLELDENLIPCGTPHLLMTRPEGKTRYSKSEDARVFRFQGELYVVYNDCILNSLKDDATRRDMYLAKITKNNGVYSVSSTPLKLVHPEKYLGVKVQKNWVPFNWNDNLLFEYSLAPHEILQTDLENSECPVVFDTYSHVPWEWGQMRGGTPAELIDGEYLAFFHSAVDARSKASYYKKCTHYFMGAYTFSQDPPFEITKMTQYPLIDNQFYNQSDFHKRVVFPGGFAVDGDFIYLAWGKDDGEIWISKIVKKELLHLLEPLKTNLSVVERMRVK